MPKFFPYFNSSYQIHYNLLFVSYSLLCLVFFFPVIAAGAGEMVLTSPGVIDDGTIDLGKPFPDAAKTDKIAVFRGRVAKELGVEYRIQFSKNRDFGNIIGKETDLDKIIGEVIIEQKDTYKPNFGFLGKLIVEDKVQGFYDFNITISLDDIGPSGSFDPKDPILWRIVRFKNNKVLKESSDVRFTHYAIQQLGAQSILGQVVRSDNINIAISSANVTFQAATSKTELLKRKNTTTTFTNGRFMTVIITDFKDGADEDVINFPLSVTATKSGFKDRNVEIDNQSGLDALRNGGFQIKLTPEPPPPPCDRNCDPCDKLCNPCDKDKTCDKINMSGILRLLL